MSESRFEDSMLEKPWNVIANGSTISPSGPTSNLSTLLPGFNHSNALDSMPLSHESSLCLFYSVQSLDHIISCIFLSPSL